MKYLKKHPIILENIQDEIIEDTTNITAEMTSRLLPVINVNTYESILGDVMYRTEPDDEEDYNP